MRGSTVSENATSSPTVGFADLGRVSCQESPRLDQDPEPLVLAVPGRPTHRAGRNRTPVLILLDMTVYAAAVFAMWHSPTSSDTGGSGGAGRITDT